MSTHKFDSLPMEGSNAFDKNDVAAITKTSAEDAFRSEYLMSADLKVLPKNEIKLAEYDTSCKANQTKDTNGNCKDNTTSHGGATTHGWFYNWYYGTSNSSSSGSTPAEKSGTPTKPAGSPESNSPKPAGSSEPGSVATKTIERSPAPSTISRPVVSEPIIPRTSVPSVPAGESFHGSFGGGFAGEAGGFGG